MRIDLPDGLEAFAREFSRFKTPGKRTQGWQEQPHERRGEGDLLDTVGTLMLWRFLVERGIPSTYFLTAGEGDEADLRVSRLGKRMNVNVKTSKWLPKNNDEPCRWSRIGIKEVELSKKPLADLFVHVIVHLNLPRDVSHVHLCSWIVSESEEFKRQEIVTIPNSNDTRGYWIGSDAHHPISKLVPFLLAEEG